MQFLLVAYDGTDEKALDRRLAVRQKHFDFCTPLKESGNMKTGAAILDSSGKMIGSVIIYDFPSRKELDERLANEPYITGKVWEKIEIKPCKLGPMFEK